MVAVSLGLSNLSCFGVGMLEKGEGVGRRREGGRERKREIKREKVRVSLGGLEHTLRNPAKWTEWQNVHEAVSWCLSFEHYKIHLVDQALSLKLAFPPAACEFTW